MTSAGTFERIDLRFLYLSNTAGGHTELIMVPNQTAFQAIITVVDLKNTRDFFCDHH